MVSKNLFRTICSLIGIFGIMIILITNMTGWGSWALVLMCIFIIVYGYLSTGRYGEYFTGEYQEKGNAY